MHLLKNFKSFVDARLNLLQPVTMLVGKNGSGKTNAIEGVELLAQLANGTPVYEISDIGRSSRAYEVRGGLRDCVRKGNTAFSLGFNARVRFDGSLQNVIYEICVDAAREPYIKAERLVIGSRTIFDAGCLSHQDLLSVQYDNFARGGNKPTTTISSDRSALSRYSSFAIFPEKSNKNLIRDAQNVIRVLSRHLNSSFVFDPTSKLMRGYERINQTVLRRDGSNISSVLFSMKNGDRKDQEVLASILRKISQLPEEPFLEFDFVETRQGDVLFGFKREDGELIDARILSDGTLRALAILTALESSPENSRVIVEEIDNGIHPSRVSVLLDAVWEASERRSLNVLATTHNPASLNALNQQRLAAVVVCAYDERSASSVLLGLDEIPRSEAIFAGGRLGDYVTKEMLDNHLLPGFEEDQRRGVLEWLEKLQ